MAGKHFLFIFIAFAAIVRSVVVQECGSRRHRYTGIMAEFDVINSGGTVVVNTNTQCGQDWAGVVRGIKYQLQYLEEQQEQERKEKEYLTQLKKEASEHVGERITP